MSLNWDLNSIRLTQTRQDLGWRREHLSNGLTRTYPDGRKVSVRRAYSGGVRVTLYRSVACGLYRIVSVRRFS